MLRRHLKCENQNLSLSEDFSSKRVKADPYKVEISALFSEREQREDSLEEQPIFKARRAVDFKTDFHAYVTNLMANSSSSTETDFLDPLKAVNLLHLNNFDFFLVNLSNLVNQFEQKVSMSF